MYTRIMYINPFDIMWISYVKLSIWDAKFVLYVFAGKMWWKMWKHGKPLNSKIVLVCRQKQETKRSCMCPTGQILVNHSLAWGSFLADFTWTVWKGDPIWGSGRSAEEETNRRFNRRFRRFSKGWPWIGNKVEKMMTCISTSGWIGRVPSMLFLVNNSPVGKETISPGRGRVV